MRAFLVPCLFASVLIMATQASANEYDYADDDGSVHEPSLEALRRLGYLQGTECGDNKICPERGLLRWEFAVWMVTALKDHNNGYSSGVIMPRFEDVDTDQWWSWHVEMLAHLGVTTGCVSASLFCPKAPVTRGQMASFLVRAFGLPATNNASVFQDVAGNVHEPNINALAAAQLTVGCSSVPSLYCPDDFVTRAQMATFMARGLGLVELADGSTRTFSGHSNVYVVPTFFCVKQEAYTEQEMLRIVENASADVRQFYLRESSGLADISLRFEGSLSPDIDWEQDFDDEFLKGKFNISGDCLTDAIEAANGEHQILVLIGLQPGEGAWGRAWQNSGPAGVSLTGKETGQASLDQSHLNRVIAHELGHSLFGWGHLGEEKPTEKECELWHLALMLTSDSVCYPFGRDDPLLYHHVDCFHRQNENWACGDTQTIVDLHVPRSHKRWHSFWSDTDNMDYRGVINHSVAQNMTADPDEHVLLNGYCYQKEPNGVYYLGMSVSWKGRKYAGVGRNPQAQARIEFEDGTVRRVSALVDQNRRALFFGTSHSSPSFVQAARSLMRTIINKEGQSMVVQFGGLGSNQFRATFDTTGADIAVQSVLNFCKGGAVL